MGWICPLFWMGRAGLLFLDIDTGEGDSLALSQESCSMQHPPFAAKEPPKVSKGRPESPLAASAEAKPSVKREKARRAFPLPFHKQSVPCSTLHSQQRNPRRFPKGDRKALWSPPQRRNPPRNGKKQGEPFPCPSTRKLFLVRGFARLWADEVRWKGVFFVKFPHRGPNCPLHVFSGKFPASSVKFFLLLPCLNAVEF